MGKCEELQQRISEIQNDLVNNDLYPIQTLKSLQEIIFFITNSNDNEFVFKNEENFINAFNIIYNICISCPNNSKIAEIINDYYEKIHLLNFDDHLKLSEQDLQELYRKYATTMRKTAQILDKEIQKAYKVLPARIPKSHNTFIKVFFALLLILYILICQLDILSYF